MTIRCRKSSTRLEILLDEDVKLNRYHTIQILILLASSVEDPADTREYYDRAQTVRPGIARRDSTIKSQTRTRFVPLRFWASS
jgi:hypothetical protein